MKGQETAFRTIVEVPEWPDRMLPSEHFVFLGSCFAGTIGSRFQSYGLNATCNPLGTLYNPESIAMQIRQALEGSDALPLFHAGKEWRCWWTSTLLGGRTEEECRQAVEGGFALLGETLRTADRIFLTVGSSVVYRLRSNGMTVTNCHKAPADLFEEVQLDVDECHAALVRSVDLIRRHCPKAKVILTVSPYRYHKYGFHVSQLIKATLLLAVDRLCKTCPEACSYFPAYELVLDDLRDYRFYADDMIHPSALAADYIWNRLEENCMSASMMAYLMDYENIRRGFMHRPSDEQSPAHQTFIRSLQAKQQALWQKYGVN